MNDAAFHFLRTTSEITEFSALTGFSKATIRDWRKRGMIDGYGAPLPSGAWGYSMQDAMQVHIAKTFSEAGFPWKDALFVGRIVGGYLTAKSQYKGTEGGKHYDVQYLTFFQTGRYPYLEHAADNDLNRMVQSAFEIYGPTVVQVVDLLSLFVGLPEDYRNALVAMEG